VNWLITGGCGFLGTAFVRSLVEEGGHAVRVVDDLSVGEREDLGAVCRYVEPSSDLSTFPPSGEPVELIVGDITDEHLALRAAQGADVIVHLAANTGVAPSVEDPRRDCMSNVLGTFNYLEAARHNSVGRFVFASSGAAVGEVEPPIHEELAPHPVSPYGASKLAGEGYCSSYFRTFGIQTGSAGTPRWTSTRVSGALWSGLRDRRILGVDDRLRVPGGSLPNNKIERSLRGGCSESA